MKHLTLIAALCLATASAAQDDPRSAAETFVQSEGQQNLLDTMLSTEGVMAQMGLVAGQLPPEKMQAIAEIVADELDTIRPVMETAMIEGMSETFTLEEINALAEFYASDVGASAMSKMNPYMAETMQSLGPAFQEMQARLAQRVQEEMSR
jgi:hypothetical protein